MDQEFMSKVETKVDAPATQSTLDATAIPAPRGAAAMQLKDVSVSFHGRTAVRDCTFDITKNRVTSLIGPSGSGKTTLLRALNRLHDLTPGAKVGGTIMLEGTDIYRGDITVTELRTRVGMVFQRPNPFPTMSIYENAISGLRFNGIKKKSILDEAAETSLQVRGPLGQRPEPPQGRGVQPLRGRAAAAVHRARPRDGPRGPLDGRAHVGPRPDCDTQDRRVDDRVEEARHRHHRDPQHAAGCAYLERLCLLVDG